MNIVLQNDLDNFKFFSELLENEEMTDAQRQELITARVDSELQTIPKLEAMAYSIRKNEADIKFLEERAKELKARTKRMEQFMDWTRESIVTYMEQKGLETLEGETYSFKLAKVAASLEIVDPSLIPQKFKRETITVDYPKDAIKKALDQFEDVPGVKLVTDKKRLIIK